MRFPLITSLALFASLGLAAPASAEPHGEDPNQCAHVDGKPVPSSSGFRHVVRVRNTCTHVVTCEVWTNVDSKTKATLDVPASGQAEKVLRESSPISIFRAKANCSF